MRIRFLVDGTSLAATLDDTAVARDFASLLPLTLAFEDYASAEKKARLMRSGREVAMFTRIPRTPALRRSIRSCPMILAS